MSRSDDQSRGVKVEVGEKQAAAVDGGIVVEYGIPIMEAARNIRTHVTDAVETMTGLDVVEINIRCSTCTSRGPTMMTTTVTTRGENSGRKPRVQ